MEFNLRMIKITEAEYKQAIMKANLYGLTRQRVVNIDLIPKAWYGTAEGSHECYIYVEDLNTESSTK